MNRPPLSELQAKQEAAARDLEEFVEEHTGEEGTAGGRGQR